MATLAEIVAARANPSGKSTQEIQREVMLKRAAEAVKNKADQVPAQTMTPAEVARAKAEERAYNAADTTSQVEGKKRGGSIKKMASGGKVGSASRRADGIAQRGKTRGKMV